MENQTSRCKGKQRITEVLEVEDEEQRHEHIHDLLSRINASLNAVPSELPLACAFRDRSALPVDPPFELLSRVQAFLPELAASNAELLRRAKEDPKSIDIENIDEDQLQYIEMNLGLGVFESRGQVPSDIPVAEVDLDLGLGNVEMDGSDSNFGSDPSSASSSTNSDSSDDSDSDSDSNGADIVAAPSATRTIRPLPTRATRQWRQQQPITSFTKPEIVVLSESKGVDRSASP